MRALLVFFVTLSVPAMALDSLVIESHTETIELFGVAAQRRVEGYDAQKRLRINVTEYKSFSGNPGPQLSYMLSIKHPDREAWIARPISQDEFLRVSTALTSSPKKSIFNRLGKGCRTTILLEKHLKSIAAASDCSKQ